MRIFVGYLSPLAMLVGLLTVPAQAVPVVFHCTETGHSRRRDWIAGRQLGRRARKSGCNMSRGPRRRFRRKSG